MPPTWKNRAVSIISRGFRGRGHEGPPDRVPPGQHLTDDFPVLSAGPTPHVPLAEWTFSIVGEVDEPGRWTWEEFRELPSESVTKDIHCVTKWSKLDTIWTGRLGRHDARRGRDSGRVRRWRSATAATRPTCRSTTSRAARRGSRTSTTASRSIPSTAARRGCSSHTSISGRAPSGCAALSPAERGRARLLGVERLPPARRPMARAAVLGRLTWQLGEVVEIVQETPRVASLVLEVPDWPGHLAGQHVDVRLTAEDGYQAQRSYSIASRARGAASRLTVERLDGRRGLALPGRRGARRRPARAARADRRLLRVGRAGDDRPLLLIAGGSGVVPLMAMIRHRAATGAGAPVRLLYSSRTIEDVIYRDELARRSAATRLDGRPHADALAAARLGRLRAADRRRDGAARSPGPRRDAPRVFICGPTRVRRDGCRRCSSSRATTPAGSRPSGSEPQEDEHAAVGHEARRQRDRRAPARDLHDGDDRARAPARGAARAQVAPVDVYMNAPGVVVRCPACESVLMRIVRAEAKVLDRPDRHAHDRDRGCST